jgi:outer membrane immunogenic protein
MQHSNTMTNVCLLRPPKTGKTETSMISGLLSMRGLPFLVGFLAVSAVPALAADLAVPAKPQTLPMEEPVAFTWAGRYAGFGAGLVYAPMRVERGGNRSSTNLGAEGTKVPGSSGFIINGYNFQSGNWVYGIEGEIAVHEAKGDFDKNGTNAGLGDYVVSNGVRGRVGYAFGRFLPFVAVGLTQLGLAVRSDINSSDGEYRSMLGLQAGVGADYAWNDWLVTRLEYVYSHFGEQGFRFNGGRSDVSLDSHAVRVAIIIKENGRAEGTAGSDGFRQREGFYFGRNVGYTMGDAQLSDGLDIGYTPQGFETGVFGGYDMRFGSLILGAEIGGTMSFAEGKGGTAPDRIDNRRLWQAEGRAKVGYQIGRFTPYVAGGFTLEQWDFRREDVFGNGRDTTDQAMHYGAIAAVGVDVEFTPRIFGRAEYAYSFYAPQRANFGLAGGKAEHELQNHTFRLGLGMWLTD